MGFHFFAKRVYDEDLYFLRSLMEEFGSKILDVCNVQVAKNIFNGIIDKNGLRDKLNELSENGHYIITECHYSDPVKKYKYARDIWEASECIVRKLPLNDKEATHIRCGAIGAIHKIELEHNQKVKFIREVICAPYNWSEDIVQVIVEDYLRCI